MHVEEQPLVVEAPEHLTPPVPRPIRSWIAILPALVYWSWIIFSYWLELPTFARFASRLVAGLLLALFTLTWWWINRRTPLRDRAIGFAIVVIGGIVAIPLCDPTVGANGFGIIMGPLSIVLTAWTIATLVTRGARPGLRWTVLTVAVFAAWASLDTVRLNGLSGDLLPEMHWRWTPVAEAEFLAEREQIAAKSPTLASKDNATVAAQPGDWAEFRGPLRDGELHGASIRTDWKTLPPKLIWRHRVGPGWSSIIVVDGRVFTQEQRADLESTVCYDAATGQEIWSYGDPVRFTEETAGAGPRATPCFTAGRVVALGCTGLLNCLDAATGKKVWSRDLRADSGAAVPHWGFTSSPLAVGDRVVVFAGGTGPKNLFAFDIHSGDIAWTSPVGESSYGSPQLLTVAGDPQILMLSNRGLTAVQPETGVVLWEHLVPISPSAPRSIQPAAFGEAGVVMASEADLGLALVDVAHSGKDWTATRRWTSRAMKPAFNDFVVSRGHAFGFDGRLFTCVDLETGNRSWKDGRFGEGQVLLLADQKLLLILSESGEVVLLKANPEKYELLGRFQAIQGKTWTYPVIAHDRLYVRNAEEMACFEVAPPAPR
jgi:outer membrane protein assembly factor BamB